MKALLRYVVVASCAAFPFESVFAQGADACGNAQVVVGLGVFAFDNSAATTDGSPDNLCFAFGQAQIERDVWFSWTATQGGAIRIDTCGQTSIDSRIAVYEGSCAGAVLACNDDTCSLQSQVDFLATQGSVYVIRIGNYLNATAGSGTFSISATPLPAVVATATNPANGHEYRLLDTSNWQLAQFTGAAAGGYLTSVNDAAEQAWIGSTFGAFGGSAIDIWIGLNDAAVEGTFVWSSGEPVTYTNWNAGEPNNAGVGEDYAHIAKNSSIQGWNDLPNPGTSFHNFPQGLIEIPSAAPVVYCTSGTSSNGCVASMGFGGVASASASSGFALTCSQVEILRNGILFYALSNPGFTPTPWGPGTSLLCVKSPTQRTTAQFSGGSAPCTGAFSLDWRAFMAANPGALGNPLASGASFDAQYWYRDPPSPKTTMLSNAVRFTLQP